MSKLAALIALLGLIFTVIAYAHALDYCPRPEELPACDNPQPVTLCRSTQEANTVVTCYLCHNDIKWRAVA